MADTNEIVHVVLVEWADDAPADVSEQASRLSTEHLTGIDGVLSVSSGGSVSPEQLEAGFTWMLVVRFRDPAAPRPATPTSPTPRTSPWRPTSAMPPPASSSSTSRPSPPPGPEEVRRRPQPPSRPADGQPWVASAARTERTHLPRLSTRPVRRAGPRLRA